MSEFKNERPAILDRIEAMGYPVFENGDYDVNIIGVRSAERQAGAFDDVIHLAYKANGMWRHFEFCATCDPGAALAPQSWCLDTIAHVGSLVFTVASIKRSHSASRCKSIGTTTAMRLLT
jgi:hypothetical protein